MLTGGKGTLCGMINEEKSRFENSSTRNTLHVCAYVNKTDLHYLRRFAVWQTPSVERILRQPISTVEEKSTFDRKKHKLLLVKRKMVPLIRKTPDTAFPGTDV